MGGTPDFITGGPANNDSKNQNRNVSAWHADCIEQGAHAYKNQMAPVIISRHTLHTHSWASDRSAKTIPAIILLAFVRRAIKNLVSTGFLANCPCRRFDPRIGCHVVLTTLPKLNNLSGSFGFCSCPLAFRVGPERYALRSPSDGLVRGTLRVHSLRPSR